ncbi:MAG: hypothetical protein SWH68_06165 [Thermodesulfobacteriota bacterium]|nr:hypothetical protein [Thermodesulfobacteriota bacterium]
MTSLTTIFGMLPLALSRGRRDLKSGMHLASRSSGDCWSVVS